MYFLESIFVPVPLLHMTPHTLYSTLPLMIQQFRVPRNGYLERYAQRLFKIDEISRRERCQEGLVVHLSQCLIVVDFDTRS